MLTPNHGVALQALLRAAQEELGTNKIIIVAEINGTSVVSVSAGCKGNECGILAEALMNVDGPLEEIT